MPLTPARGVARAAWVVDAAAADSWRLIELGPPGYQAYARVLHPEETEGHLPAPLLESLCEVLDRHTGTTGDCLFCLWEGYGDVAGGGAVAVRSTHEWPRPFRRLRHRLHRRALEVPPAFPAWFMDGPKVEVPHRDYYLFEGALAEAGDWGAADLVPGLPRDDMNSPNLFWPADRAWFVATELDSAWTGVAGSRDLVDALLADDRFDAVETEWAREQPRDR